MPKLQTVVRKADGSLCYPADQSTLDFLLGQGGEIIGTYNHFSCEECESRYPRLMAALQDQYSLTRCEAGAILAMHRHQRGVKKRSMDTYKIERAVKWLRDTRNYPVDVRWVWNDAFGTYQIVVDCNSGIPGFPYTRPVPRSMSLRCGDDPITRNEPKDYKWRHFWNAIGNKLRKI